MTTPAAKPQDGTKREENSPVSRLVSNQGTTTIADTVVQKVAGLATREIPGVYDLGSGTARALSALRERIPGATASAGQGVAVEVGEKEAAVDLQVIVEYGVAITDVSRSIRRNVITSIEQMTGLEVVEVNINVSDVHIPSDDDTEPEQTRVQ